jgi:tRNA(Arg) A34 adenosine deaminase TadA
MTKSDYDKEQHRMESWQYRMRAFFVVIGCIAILLVLIALLPYAHWHLLLGREELSGRVVTRLQALGMESLQSKDVPVAAILIYGDSIIGEGFNTVVRDHNAGGHAEINALSSAIGRVGRTAFSQLNRDSLVLISTFEPCTMCMGAILEYRIKQVRFLKPKPFFFLLREELRAIRYRWRLEQSGPEALQDSLFYSYPGYRPN